VPAVIQRALEFLEDELDNYIRNRLATDPKKGVRLTRLVDDQGALAFGSRVGMALVRVDEERVFGSKQRVHVADDTVTYLAQPEQALELHVIFVARESGNAAAYGEALRALSVVVGFFQSRRSFTPANSPQMANMGLVRLNVELETVDYEVQNHIWGSLGGKLLPSVLYLIRLIAIDELNVTGTADPIDNINVRSARE
jgi:hypothetical protein